MGWAFPRRLGVGQRKAGGAMGQAEGFAHFALGQWDAADKEIGVDPPDGRGNAP